MAKARGLGLVLDGPALQAGTDYAKSLDAIKASGEGLRNSIGHALIPAVKPLVDELTTWISNNRELVASKIGEWARDFAAWVEEHRSNQVGAGMKSFIEGVGSVARGLGNWKLIVGGLIALKIAPFLLSTAAGFTAIATAAAAATGALIGYEAYQHLLANNRVGRGIGAGVAGVASAFGSDGARTAIAESNWGGLSTAQRQAAAKNYASLRASAERVPDFQPGNGSNHRVISASQRRPVEPLVIRSRWLAQLRRCAEWVGVRPGVGIAANLGTESGFNPSAVGDRGAAYGIGQWHADRQRAFEKFAGRSIVGSSLEDQLKFVNYELTEGGERSAGDRLRTAKTAGDAAGIVSRYDERPADTEGEASRRGALAERVAPEGPYGSGGGGADPTVHVEVTMSNAPPGTKVKTTTTGGATASARIGHSAIGEIA